MAKKKEKPRHEKTAVELDFDDFVSWATSMVLFRIAEGDKLRNIIHIILDHAARNEVWGGGRKGKS
jgi:hypothetical protein